MGHSAKAKAIVAKRTYNCSAADDDDVVISGHPPNFTRKLCAAATAKQRVSIRSMKWFGVYK